MEENKLRIAQFDVMDAIAKVIQCNIHNNNNNNCKKELRILDESVINYNKLSSNKLVCLNKYEIDRQTSSLDFHYLCKMVTFDVTTNSLKINEVE